MMETISQGVRISYDQMGHGEPALLMMPGWCANRTTMFSQLMAHTSKRRATLALDWRGHGASAAPSGDFGAADLVQDALAVIAASGARHIIPVATSHAGWIALELRRQLGERIPQLVLLDWIILEAPLPFIGTLTAFQNPQQWEPAREQLFAMWLAGVENPDVIRLVKQEMGAHGFEMWARAGREILAAYTQVGSPLKALAELDPPVPTLHLYSQPPDPGYLAAQQTFAAEHPWFQVQRLTVPGHFPMVEVPEVVAAAIERFVARADAG
jgi:pimeloyl-ACP methyl ester carboxylesterase